MLPANDHVLEYVDDYLHEVLSPADALRVERHCDVCPICKVALDEARKRLDVVGALPPCEASAGLIQATLRRIDAHQDRSRRFRRRAVWAAGLYVAAAVVVACFHWHYSHLSVTPYDLEVLGQNSLLAGSAGSLRVRLLNHVTGVALAGVPVTVDLLDAGTGRTAALASFETDNAGRGQPRFTLPDWNGGRYELRVTARPDGKAEVMTQSVQLRRSWKLMLSSDKPVYQPGQTIHLRSLALRRPDLKPVAGQESVFGITDPRGNLVFKRRDVTSKYGIAAADCPLATEITEGAYTVTCRVGDTESKLTLDVKKYVLPKFKVRLELDRPYYQPGERVTGSVHADYFFGKPVAGAEVMLEGHTGDIPGQQIQHVRTKTDDAGRAKFAFVLPDTLVGREPNGDARLRLHAAVTDSAGQKQTADLSRAVTAQPLRVEVIPEAGSLVRGVANTVYLLATYADDRPARVRLAVSGQSQELRTNDMGVASFRLTPQAASLDLTVRATDDQGRTGGRTVHLECDQQQDAFLIRTDRAVYRGGDTMRLVALGGGQEPAFVDVIKDGQIILTETVEMKNGRGELQFDLPAELFGTLELSAYRLGRSGQPVRKTRALYVNRPDKLRVRAALDHDSYHPGGRARVGFTVTDSKGRPTPAALSLAAVDEAVFSVLQQRPGMEGTFYTLEEELLKPVYVIYAWSPQPAGGVAAPERAEFEQALFARTAQTEEAAAAGVVPTAPRYSVNASTFAVKAQDAAFRSSHGLHGVHLAWLVLVGLLAGAGYAALWLLVPARHMAILHAIAAPLMVCAGFATLISMVHERAPMAGNKSVEVWDMTPRDGVVDQMSSAMSVEQAATPKAMLEASNPQTAESGAPPVRVRDFFPETLLWRPELITDDHGRAEVDVDLADSITTWRLTAGAVSADGHLGAAETSIRVTQPFFVDVNLPVSLMRGDEVAIPVVVYNYLDRPQTVRLTLKDAGWCTRLDQPVRTVTVPAHQVRGTSYRVRVTRVGRHGLQLDARTPEAADAVKRSIEVVPDGRPVERVVNGALQEPAAITLDVPADAVEGSVKAILKVYPSGFSQLVEGLDAIFQRPYGCFEQTSSTTYPNVLALDYLRRTKKSAPAVEARAREYIHLGYQRLLGFEVPGGGFDWFGRPPANRTLTAYGLMEFQDMARVHDVDPRLIERTRSWLLAQRQADGSWLPDNQLHDDPTLGSDASLARLTTTAYIAWAVFGGRPDDAAASLTRRYLLDRPADKIQDPYVLALVANALLAMDPDDLAVSRNGFATDPDLNGAGPYLARLAELKQTSADGKQVWWEQAAGRRTAFYGAGRSGNVEVTALAALALMHGRRESALVRGALAWLAGQKDARGTWYSTQATVLALKALVTATDLAGAESQARRIEIALGGNLKRSLTIPADQSDVLQQVDLSPYLRPGSQRLTLREPTGAGSLYQVVFRYHVPGRQRRENAEPLSITLAYDRTTLAVDDTVAVTATVVNRMKQTAPMVVLDLPVPGGFTVVADDLAGAAGVAKVQVTPRSAVVYLRGLEPGRPLRLRYRLRATMPVKVTVPAARAYEYYDEDHQGFSRPAALAVTERK